MASIHVTPPLLYTAATILPTVCALAVAARFKIRNALGTGHGWDDWLTLPALFLVFGMAATILAGTGMHALGRPTPSPPPGVNQAIYPSREQTITRKTYYIMVLVQIVCLTCIKLSCVAFYRRVFNLTTQYALNTATILLNTLILAWGIGFAISFAFSCGSNFSYLWTDVSNLLKCPANLVSINLGLSISDTIFDVIIFLFPIPLLQMSKARKVVLVAIFAMGAAAIAASVVRLAIIVQELNAMLAANADQDMVSTTGDYFIFIEACFALIAICLPTLSGASKFRLIRTPVTHLQGWFSLLSFERRDSRKISDISDSSVELALQTAAKAKSRAAVGMESVN